MMGAAEVAQGLLDGSLLGNRMGEADSKIASITLYETDSEG